MDLHLLPAAPDDASESPSDPVASTWTPYTQEVLATLTVRERGFVEHFASGLSAAEAYRRASPNGPGRCSLRAAQHAYKIKSRPRVRLAIQAVLSDRNVGARINRETMLLQLKAIIEEGRMDPRPAAKQVIINAITIAAKIQGEIPARPVPMKQQSRSSHQIQLLIDQIIAEAMQSSSTGSNEGL